MEQEVDTVLSVHSVIGKLEDITVRLQLRKISTKYTKANVLRDR